MYYQLCWSKEPLPELCRWLPLHTNWVLQPAFVWYWSIASCGSMKYCQKFCFAWPVVFPWIEAHTNLIEANVQDIFGIGLLKPKNLISFMILSENYLVSVGGVNSELFFSLQIILLMSLCLQISTQVKRQKTLVISDISDIKEFKKLLRSKTNVLVLYINNHKSSQNVSDVFKDAANGMRGQATLVTIDCTGRYV